MDFATTACIRRWFREMMAFVQSVPWEFRFNCDESMITLSKGEKVVVSPGQQAFERKVDTLPHFTVMPCFNAMGRGPPPMLVVPNLQSANSVFRAWEKDCLITTSPNGWVVAETWVEWARMVCAWVEEYRAEMSAPSQTVVLFVDSAPTRSNLDALAIFREHNVRVITFPPHLTHILQPVDVAWARRFKSQFRDSFRNWRKDMGVATLRRYLAVEGTLSATMLRRGQIVAAAVDAATSSRTRYVCATAFAVAGLVSGTGEFSPELPLQSKYVHESDDDPELVAKRADTRKRVFISSRVLTSDEAIAELEERKRTKVQRKTRRTRRALVEVVPQPVATDEFEADDGVEYEGWMRAAAVAMPPDPGDQDEE